MVYSLKYRGWLNGFDPVNADGIRIIVTVVSGIGLQIVQQFDQITIFCVEQVQGTEVEVIESLHRQESAIGGEGQRVIRLCALRGG